MTDHDIMESKKLRARLSLQNATTHADQMAAEHGFFSIEALNARMVERAARDAYVATLDEAIDLCRAGATP